MPRKRGVKEDTKVHTTGRMELTLSGLEKQECLGGDIRALALAIVNCCVFKLCEITK